MMSRFNKDVILKYLYSNKEVKNFCTKNKLKDDDALRNFQALSAYKEFLESCNNCDGSCCNAKVKDQIMTLTYDGKIVEAEYEKCPKVVTEDYSNYEVLCYTENNIELVTTQARAMLMGFFQKFIDEYKLKKFAKGIYLWGECGTGKSLLLYKFGQLLSSQGIKVIFAYYPDLVREFQNLIGTGDLEELIVKLKKVDILILDDIGRESNTQYVRDEILGPIMQYRVDNELPMFVTSNRDMKGLEKHLSETNTFKDTVKASALIERFKFLMKEYELKDKDFRNS